MVVITPLQHHVMTYQYNEASFLLQFGIKAKMLDTKALDPMQGPFAKIYSDSVIHKINEFPIGGGIAIISEKKDAVAYVPHELAEKFFMECRNLKTVACGNMFIIRVPLEVSECRQAIAAVVLRAAYDLPIQLYNWEGVEHAQGLCMSWGAKTVQREINRKIASLGDSLK